MASASDFSSGRSDHEDSDTIVISSRSRILISPRKKGSKAVSNLLGSAADDVVDQLLRGSGGSAEVVSKSRSSKVRVGDRQFAQGWRTQEDQTMKVVTNSSTAVGPGIAVRERRSHAANEANEEAERVAARNYTSSRRRRDQESYLSEGSSAGLSGLSSGSETENHSFHRTTRKHHTRSKQTHQQTSRSVEHNEVAEARSGRLRKQGRQQIEHTQTSSGDDSEASSSTKGSSLSHREIHGRQRKFDDQLQATSDSFESVGATKKSRATSTTRTPESTSLNGSRRGHGSRRVEASNLDDSVILPKSATQEMEDLKQTLKNLASQDPLLSKSSTRGASTVFLGSPLKKSSSFSGTAQGMSQLRKDEYVGPERTQHIVEWSSVSPPPRVDESSYHRTTEPELKLRGHHRAESDSDSDQTEPSIARRLFSTPPQRISAKFSTSPTVPVASQLSRRTPSPKRAGSLSSPYTSSLDMNLTAAATSTAQGSRAVLSALKALQDKIRRLEEEREKLLQELSDVKVKARKREAVFASAEKQFTYEVGQTKESARAAYDAIRSEREELRLELVKYEERRKAMEGELQHANKLSSTYSAKAEDLKAQLQASETQRNHQHTEMDAMRSAHKQELHDMKNEIATLQREKQTAQDQAIQLQAQFEREAQSHAETRERLHETEQMVAGVAQLNDKLVAKVWEANEIATKATKKSKKLQLSQRVSTLSRPTAASRAASISASNGPTTPARRGSIITKNARSGSVTAKGSGSTKKRASQMQQGNNLELLRAANLGREIPFVLGTSANRSHSIISNVQEAIRQCDTSYATPLTNLPPSPTYLKTKKSSIRQRKPSDTYTGQDRSAPAAGVSASILGLETSQPATLVRSRTNSVGLQSVESGSAHGTKRPSVIRVPTPSSSYPNPMKSQIMDDLQAAVENAEKEFRALNRRYKDAAAKVESGQDGAGHLSTALGSMLDELEAKGKQLNLLKQVYDQASRSTINPVHHIVHSPEAVQRKTASLRILNDYRQMERDAKSPRSAATTNYGTLASPTGTNGASRRASFFSDNE